MSLAPFHDRMRFIGVALPLAGLGYTVGLLVRGKMIDPLDAAGYAQWISEPSFRAGWAILVIGSLCELIGLWSLYAALSTTRSERLGFWSMLALFVNRAIILGMQMVFIVAPESLGAIFTDLGQAPKPLLALVLLVPPTMLGCLLLGVAIWRSGTLPKGAAVLFALHIPLLSIAPSLSYPLEVAGGVCLLVGGAWMLMRRPATA